MTARRSLPYLLVLALPLLSWPQAPAAASSGRIGEIVMSVCLSAFESEMAQAGKRPPAGMANYACSCVVDKISSGLSIDAARSNCRLATARRYPI
jgi:hypothetical protein